MRELRTINLLSSHLKSNINSQGTIFGYFGVCCGRQRGWKWERDVENVLVFGEAFDREFLK